MMSKKDEVIKNSVVDHLLKVIQQLKHEKEMMIMDRDAVNNVAILNFEIVQRDADTIRAQAKEIKDLKQVLDINNKLSKKEKLQIYHDMNEQKKSVQAQYD